MLEEPASGPGTWRGRVTGRGAFAPQGVDAVSGRDAGAPAASGGAALRDYRSEGVSILGRMPEGGDPELAYPGAWPSRSRDLQKPLERGPWQTTPRVTA